MHFRQLSKSRIKESLSYSPSVSLDWISQIFRLKVSTDFNPRLPRKLIDPVGNVRQYTLTRRFDLLVKMFLEHGTVFLILRSHQFAIRGEPILHHAQMPNPNFHSSQLAAFRISGRSRLI